MKRDLERLDGRQSSLSRPRLHNLFQTRPPNHYHLLQVRSPELTHAVPLEEWDWVQTQPEPTHAVPLEESTNSPHLVWRNRSSPMDHWIRAVGSMIVASVVLAQMSASLLVMFLVGCLHQIQEEEQAPRLGLARTKTLSHSRCCPFLTTLIVIWTQIPHA